MKGEAVPFLKQAGGQASLHPDIVLAFLVSTKRKEGGGKGGGKEREKGKSKGKR